MLSERDHPNDIVTNGLEKPKGKQKHATGRITKTPKAEKSSLLPVIEAAKFVKCSPLPFSVN